jgi:phytoene dehydrogenase-like protein
MTETTSSPLNNVITIDDERIKNHLDQVVRGRMEETLNALLEAEADRLFCQHVAPQAPNGSSWDEYRDTVADLMIETVDLYAPNFRRSVLARQVFSPLDLERIFGLVAGDIFHGSLDPGQLFSARPMLGYADYRGPIASLYLCGAGSHPGGGLTGAPGHNAAREILRDFRHRRIKRAQ